MFTFSIDLPTALRHFSLIFGATLSSFLIVTLLTKPYYKLLLKYGVKKQLRDSAVGGGAATIFNELHAHKKGTPTMGGVLIWVTVAVIVLASPIVQWLGLSRFSLFNREETYLPVFTLIATGALGLIDDILNVRGSPNKGLRVKPKFFWLTVFVLRRFGIDLMPK